MNQVKTCTICEEEKEKSNFRKSGKTYGDGLFDECNACLLIRKKNNILKKKETTDLITTKICKDCKKEKLKTEFGNAIWGDGYLNICKTCNAIKRKEYDLKKKISKKEVQEEVQEIVIETTTKICSECKIEKQKSEYIKSGTTWGDGLRSICKSCSYAKVKSTREENRKDPEYIDDYNRKQRELYHRDKSHQQASSSKWYETNKEEINQKRRENQDKTYEQRKKFYENNPEKKLMLAARSRVTSDFKFGKSSENLVSCNYNFLKEWFEFHFSIDNNLNFNNHGIIWHIDHVLPCAIFDASDEEDLKKCMHWSNLMPLEIEKNLKKSSKICHISIQEQNNRLKLFCDIKKINIIQLTISDMQDTSTAGNSSKTLTTTLDEEIIQDTRGNDLWHSKNVKDGTIRMEKLRLWIHLKYLKLC